MNNIFHIKTVGIVVAVLLSGALLYVGLNRSDTETPSLESGSSAKIEEVSTTTKSDESVQAVATSSVSIATTTPAVVMPTTTAPAPVTTKPAPVVAPVKVDPAPVLPVVKDEPVLVPVESTGITMTEVAGHANAGSCWSVINGGVYDLTSYIPRHPGGKSEILAICGKDGSRLFEGQHGGESKPEKILAGFYLDALVD
jgi:cytochrome b involved in lipid metabolism